MNTETKPKSLNLRTYTDENVSKVQVKPWAKVTFTKDKIVINVFSI